MSRRPAKVFISRPTEVLISYSRKDDEARRALEFHLAPLKHQGLIDKLSAKAIESGQAWTLALDEALGAGAVALVLVSSDFLASAVSWTPQLSLMFARDQRRRGRVVSVILNAVDWADSPLRSLNSLPRNRKPVTNWSDQEAAWIDIQEGVRDVLLGQLHADRSKSRSRSVPELNREGRAEIDSLALEHGEMMANLPRPLVERVEFLIEKRDATGNLSEAEERELQQLAAKATELATRHLATRLSDAGQH